jgi:hypothetical protein
MGQNIVTYLDAWLIITGFRIGWLDLLDTFLYIHTTRHYKQLQRYCWFPLFTIHRSTHTLEISVSASRILATDLNTGTITSNDYEAFLLFLLNHPGLPTLPQLWLSGWPVIFYESDLTENTPIA